MKTLLAVPFVTVLVAAFASTAVAQPRNRLAGPLDFRANRVVAGTHHPRARAEFECGPVAPETALDRMLLVLDSGPDSDAEAHALIERRSI
jgi:hypothetical protein